MEWQDTGIVIAARRHGETAAILELLTREHGRHLGLVHGGRSRRLQPVLQPGNSVLATWRARLDEGLGSFRVEGAASRVGRLIASAGALHGLQALLPLARLLPEREPVLALHDALAAILDRLDAPSEAAPLMARFELDLLRELGFGLDLAACAATGAREDLAWVSPRTGRAVSRGAGEPYRDRLLALPRFLAVEGWNEAPDRADLVAAFTLTGAFLARWVLEPRGIAFPEARNRFIDALPP